MEYYDNDNDNSKRERSDPLKLFKVILMILALFLGPAIAIGVLIFLVFLRTLKWKPRVTIIPLTIVVILLALFSSGPLNNLKLIVDFNNLGENWSTIVFSYLYLSMILGIVIGYGIILYKAFDLKRYPEYVYIKGWAYGFEYAKTPLDKWRKKRNVKSLQLGQEFDYEKAPIGIIEAPVQNADLEGTLDVRNADRASIVYRHYTEAMAHTLITGKTGSGKALHVDTEIRIKEKGWTTVGQAEVGDTLYDERGNHTKLLAVYQPMTPDHYEITFDSGEVVKCCGDHLWNIGDVSKGYTVNTRKLLENYTVGTEYKIKHKVDGIEITHKILKITRCEDNPEDYLCFTVDAPSHLFLITRSYIPTHNTVTMLSLIQNDILAGNPLCVIDFKKSPDLIYFLSKWAKESGREFYHFLSGKPGTYKNPYNEDQSTYDPLSTGGATAKADMILNLRTWDTASEVFKKRTQDVLVSLFFLLERTPKSQVPNIEWDNGGLAQFVSGLDLNNFKKMIEIMAMDMQAGKLSDGDIRRYRSLVDLYKELSSTTKSDLKAQIVELLSIARTLIVSNYGDWLAKGASGSHINLMDIATSQDGPIVLFSFNQQEEPEFAQYIGSIVMSDLSRVSALKNAKGDQTKFGVYIDEFQTLDPGTVKDNLEKARSSKMYITLSLQSLDQIVSSAANQGEAMANAIIDTCANFIFHDGSGYDTAEKMSKIIGKSKRYVYKTTSKADNKLIKFRLMSVDKAMVSKDIEEDWLIPPSQFQSLESPAPSNNYKATAYVINKSSDDDRFVRGGGALARKIHVVVASETAEGVPKDFKQKIFIPQTNQENFLDLQSAAIIEYDEKNSVNIAIPVNAENSKIVAKKANKDMSLNQSLQNLEELEDDWVIEDLDEEEEVVNLDEASKENNIKSTTNEAQPIASKIELSQKTNSLPKIPLENSPKESSDIKSDVLEDNTQSQLDIFKQLSAKKYVKPVKKDNQSQKKPIEKTEKESVEKTTNDTFNLPKLD